MNELALITTMQMGDVDQRGIASGVSSLTLMENAGRAVAEVALSMVGRGAGVCVLCGPGNNGGDGYVAARLLAEGGARVRVIALTEPGKLTGDAARMAARWTGLVQSGDAAVFQGADLIVDALFGAGLARPLDGLAAALVEQANASGIAILAVDVPSGVDGTTGATAGPAIQASQTITFVRKKPGHLLYPGRKLCGRVVVRDIGIPEAVLGGIACTTFANAPDLWRAHFPGLAAEAHKYTRGHAVVVSGPLDKTGAARLGARGALRIGAGLVTVGSPMAAIAVNAAHLTAIMVAGFEGPRGLADLLSDGRRNATLIGPGAGVSLATRYLVQVALEFEAATVLDADALTSFTLDQDDDADPMVDHLFTLILENPRRPVVLTPHEGEFKRIFPDLAEPSSGSKVERARRAASRSGATLILKGADTVIASPDGRAAINSNAPPTLATAGSGDVLAGFVTGLLAQGMPPFEAACAAVWLHGDCATLFGPGLIAEDLPEILPRALAALAAS